MRPIVEVRDRNDLPIAGVPVVFSISGGGAPFAGGASTVTVTTNAAGRAAVTELKPVNNGAFQISVEATLSGPDRDDDDQPDQLRDAGRRRRSRTGGWCGRRRPRVARRAARAAAVCPDSPSPGSRVVRWRARSVGLNAAGVIGGNEPCTFAVSPTTVTAGSAAGTSTVNVTVSPANCEGPRMAGLDWQRDFRAP